MRLLHPLLLPPLLLINPLRGNNNSLGNYNNSSSLGINTMPQYHQQPRLISLQNMDPQIAHGQGLHPQQHHQQHQQQQQQQMQMQQQQMQQQQQTGPPPVTRVLAPGQGHHESMERIDPRQQQQQQQALHSNPPQSHHVRQLSREQLQMRPQSPLNDYPLRESEHRQVHTIIAQTSDSFNIGGSQSHIQCQYQYQDQYLSRSRDHNQDRSTTADRTTSSRRRPKGCLMTTVDPLFLQTSLIIISILLGQCSPHLDTLCHTKEAPPQTHGFNITVIPLVPLCEKVNPHRKRVEDAMQTPIAQRPASATENDHRVAPHDPRYLPPGPTQHNSAFIGHERRESYPQHPQDAPPMQPVAVHPGTDERHPQHSSHMHRGSLDAAYNPVRHPQQEPYPIQPAHPQHDPRGTGVVGQPPRHVPPYPVHSPEGRRQTANESMAFHHQNPPHQQQQLHQHQQSQYQHQQPPQPQHKQPHQYYAQHQNQQDYEQQPVPQEPEGHHSGRSSFSYQAPPPPPPPSSQAWQARDTEPLDEHGRPIDPRYPRPDSEMRLGVHGHRSAAEPIEHPPPERVIPGREPPSAMAQPPFPPNGLSQFPAGPESLRSGMVSPRDGAFNETPTGSTRSLSPESAQMGRKRGRRPKSKLDVDIAGPIPVANSPSPLVPRPGLEIAPEQQRKRGRKSKAEPEVPQRNWNVSAHDPHRQAFGHADSVMDNTNQDPTGDDNQLKSKNGHRMEIDHGQPISGHHERLGQDVTPQDKRYLEDDAGRRSDPRFERQHPPFDDMSNRPSGNFTPGSVEEFEHIQRLRQQQEQRPPEQYLQHPQLPDQHRQQYSHPQTPASPTRYEKGQVHAHSLEARSGHGSIEAQPLGPAGKEPETVQLLEADVANALVNIQHENRFQSPDGASYSESDPNKRLRLESPGHPIDPHAGHVHHRPNPPQADPQAGPAPVLEPVAIGRRDLAQDEQDTAIILQSMMNNRQAMEQGESSLLHQGQASQESQHPHFANGYPPRPASPRARGASQHGDPLQHQARHSQHGDYPPVDPHPYGLRLQDPQMQSPHSPYGHGQAYPSSDPTPHDPLHVPVSDDHAAHQQHSSIGGAPQPMHPSQRGPETSHEHGGEHNGVYHPSASYPTDPVERDASGGPRRSSNNNTPYAPSTSQPKDQWRVGSPPRGRNDVIEPSYNGHPMDQQPPPQHHTQPPQGHWPVDRPDNRGPLPPSHSYGGDTNAAPGSQELAAAASVLATPVKTKARRKAKSGGMMSPETAERPDVVMSESRPPANERDYDPRAQQQYPPSQEHGMPLHPPQPTGQSKLQQSDTPLHFGQEAKLDTGAPYKVEPSGGSKPQTAESKPTSASGKRLATPSEGVYGPSQTTVNQVVPPPERPVPNSLLFGSGMILVKKLHDASGYGTSSGSEGSTKFPPSQLSIKTGYDLSKAAGPASSTFSPSTPLSAVATALAVKKKRSKLIDIKDEVIFTSPGAGYGKNDPLPPPPPPTKGKGGNRGRKGLVLVGSSDADIERSNQITRSGGGGPAWLRMGTNAASSSLNGTIGAGAGASSTSASATAFLAADGPASATSASSAADGPGIRRRAPLSPSTLLIENDKRKPKRIKIDDKDVRQVQRTSSTLTDATDSDRKDNISSTRKSAEDDEVDSNAEGAGGDCCSSGMGSQRRRLPEEDDEDLGEEEVSRGTAGNGAHGRRQSQGQSQSQSQPQSQDQGSQGPSQAAAGSKSMKRKSNASLAGTQLSKKAKEKAKAVDSDVEPPVKSNGKTESPLPMGRSVVMGIPLKRSLSMGGSGAATPSGDTDAESDLAMEDDIKCPHIFGLDSESEHEIEEGPDDDAGNEDDDDGKSAVSTPGKANGSSDQAGSSSSSSSKVEVLDPSDPIQVQGLKWVKTLGMSEKAWEETFRTYERVKRLKELKNRQPVRKRDAILAAILYIVCRDEGSPRTFSEICTASGVRRGDIGAYYRLMLKVLKPSKAFTASARDTDAEAFMTRWCESLSLPPQVRQAAIHVFSLANTLNLTSGKCPSSVGAAAIYLCIFSWNNARRLARCKRYQCPGCQGLVSTEHPGADQDEGWIRKEQKDVAVAVGVVSATLMGCFRNLAPESDRLVPADFLRAAEEGV
ncbi:Transcription initiation factor IIB [Linnemannia hyalina]|uniref:Transcription initiation factor IIB n=1 Tax=Linnemannia hyalina TaxID=64524 RepID=A0A9P8BXW2_9FUNG|nr:Transcription initiation factor IIB [Linnemannia hyalina]